MNMLESPSTNFLQVNMNCIMWVLTIMVRICPTSYYITSCLVKNNKLAFLNHHFNNGISIRCRYPIMRIANC